MPVRRRAQHLARMFLRHAESRGQWQWQECGDGGEEWESGGVDGGRVGGAREETATGRKGALSKDSLVA